MTDAIPGRYRLRVKQRRPVVAYAQEHGLKPASRGFGLDRRTVRSWITRWKVGGQAGLVPKHPNHRKRRLPEATIGLLRQACFEQRWGAPRTRVWLARVHHIHVNPRTIQRVFRDLGMPVLTKTPRRRPRQMKLFE
jgi:transposase